MADQSILRRLCALLSHVSDTPEESLNAASTPQNTGGWDSYANLSLMASIEEEYGVTFATNDVIKFKSLGDIAAYVEEHAGHGR